MHGRSISAKNTALTATVTGIRTNERTIMFTRKENPSNGRAHRLTTIISG